MFYVALLCKDRVIFESIYLVNELSRHRMCGDAVRSLTRQRSVFFAFAQSRYMREIRRKC